jgi:hypothetical protein
LPRSRNEKPSVYGSSRRICTKVGAPCAALAREALVRAASSFAFPIPPWRCSMPSVDTIAEPSITARIATAWSSFAARFCTAARS